MTDRVRTRTCVQRSSSWNYRTIILLFQELGAAFGQKNDTYLAKTISICTVYAVYKYNNNYVIIVQYAH